MECSNKKCTHVFFRKESSYVCCPACGELRKEKLSLNEFQRMQVVAKHLKIKKLEKINEAVLYLCYILIMLPMIRALFAPDSPNHKGDGKIEGFMVREFLVIWISCSFIFLYHDKKLMVIKRCIGEYAWYLTTVVFKVIKLCFLLLVLFLFVRYLYPYMYTRTKLLYQEHNIRLETLDINFCVGKVMFIVFPLYYVFADIVELMKRKLCRDMIRLNSGG